MDKKRIKVVLLGFAIIIIAIGAYFWYLRPSLVADAMVFGVPYFGIYNVNFAETSGSTAAVHAITQYWRQLDSNLPYPSLESLNEKFDPVMTPVFPEDIKAYFDEIGYETRFVRAANPTQLIKYILQERSPLIFWQSLSPAYKGEKITYRILIGISAKQRKLWAHDFRLGPALEITFDDWAKSYPQWLAENWKYSFLVARPKNYKNLITEARIPTFPPYPDRSPYDRFYSTLIQWTWATDIGQVPAEDRVARLTTLLNDPNLSEFAPIMRIDIFNKMARSLNELGRYSEAKEMAQKALELNHDLDLPFGVWEGFPLKQLPTPWFHLGNAYLGLGDKKNATDSYAKGLAIAETYPTYKFAGKFVRETLLERLDQLKNSEP
jgi:tetratricopeptide (TPR) repeat protein